jgi:hypothetical protein
MKDGLSEIGHYSDKGGVPLVADFGEGGRPTCHEDLPNSVLESSKGGFVHAYEGMSCNFFSDVILQFPYSFFLCELLL